MKAVSLRCPHCGSTRITENRDGLLVCVDCGSVLMPARLAPYDCEPKPMPLYGGEVSMFLHLKDYMSTRNAMRFAPQFNSIYKCMRGKIGGKIPPYAVKAAALIAFLKDVSKEEALRKFKRDGEVTSADLEMVDYVLEIASDCFKRGIIEVTPLPRMRERA